MRVVQIVTQMEGGGAQRASYLLHEALNRRGHYTELWFLYLKRPTYASKPGIRVLWNHKPAALGYLLLAVRLFIWIRAHKPDVTITHTHYANILGQLASALAGVKYRVAVHHSPLQKYPALARHADRVLGVVGLYTTQVAVSDAVLKSMAAYPESYKKNVRRVYNGTVIEESNAVSGKRYLAGLPAWSPKILHVGRLAREKNHSALIDTIQRLPAASLVLVGSGELRQTIEGQVKAMGLTERVRFLGEIPPEEVRAVMRACDLFMFPSVYEAMPMALLEAMAAGMAIVASDIPANREVLEDAGVLLDPEPSKLARAAVRFLDDRDYAAEAGRRAVERARKFTVDAMADGYEHLLQS